MSDRVGLTMRRGVLADHVTHPASSGFMFSVTPCWCVYRGDQALAHFPDRRRAWSYLVKMAIKDGKNVNS
jgi:hypothetical protein